MRRENQTWFEVVQVVKRNALGRLLEWYPGDKKHEDIKSAMEELKESRKQFQGVEYVVLKTTIEEQ